MIFRRCLIWLALFSMCLVLLITACSSQVPVSQPPIPETPAPPMSPAPEPVKWLADGVISSGEYVKTNTYGDCEINWVSDEKYIYMGLKVKTSGWVALGIQPGLMMKDADIIIGTVDDDNVAVYDQFSTDSFGPHVSDVELGGSNDILEFSGKETLGYTTIEFKRSLDTGDKYDHSLLKGVNKIIWAYGSDDQSRVKHIVRGYGELDL